MFAGLTIANVIGVPLGTYLGHEFSWKISFLLVGIVGIAALLSVYFWMPMFPKTPQSNIKKDFQIFKKAELWVLILLTTIGTGGFFAWYSYIAPLLTNITGYPESMVGYAMILAGLGMVVGNFLGAKMAEKLKPLNAVVLSLGMMVLALLANTIVATHPIGILVLTFIIGIISFTVATPIQMAIIKASEGSEMLGSSMNQSAFNMGNASGAYLAGIPIAMGFEITAASYVGAALAGMGILIALGIIVNKNSDDIKIKIRRFALK